MPETPRAPVRRVRSPLVWATAGVLALALLGASVLRFVTASCAAELVPAAPAGVAGQAAPRWATTVIRGQAYFYNPGSGQGSCSFGSLPADGLYVSLSVPQYAGGAACGSYLQVSGPRGTVRTEVVDSCPGCANGGIDMSEAAFSRVASPDGGTARVSYRLVRDPRLPGPLKLRMAQSASAGWLAIQVLDNGNPLSSVQVAPQRAGGRARWQPLTLNSDDYWSAAAGAGSGPFMVEVTDIFGHRVVAGGIRLLPGSVQRTRVLMYTAARASPRHAATPTAHPASAGTGPASTAASPAGPAAASHPPAAASGSTARAANPSRPDTARPNC